jgi:hypothetical protein
VKIEERKITVRELVSSYSDKGEEGVFGFDGNLNIRPPYQREFIYKDAQRAAVVDTVRRGFPLNVMYWADHGDGTFEVMDGQQRTISLAQYVTGEFSFDFGNGPKYFYNLTQDEKDRILDYSLFIYVCAGTELEKLDWFKTINIAGEKLTPQELRNAVYHGTWLSHAKPFFSRTNGPAAIVSEAYVSGAPIRQELLELAISWACIRDGLKNVEDYMAIHQHDPNATDLWNFFETVIRWAVSTFPHKRKELKSVDWGTLYSRFGSSFPDAVELEKRVSDLMSDEDVQKKAGIYHYVLDGDQRHLNIRAFSANQKREAYELQQGLCSSGSRCLTPENSNGLLKFEIDQMEGDHITPWSKGGHTVSGNCQMLCVPCNRTKGDA